MKPLPYDKVKQLIPSFDSMVVASPPLPTAYTTFVGHIIEVGQYVALQQFADYFDQTPEQLRDVQISDGLVRVLSNEDTPVRNSLVDFVLPAAFSHLEILSLRRCKLTRFAIPEYSSAGTSSDRLTDIDLRQNNLSHLRLPRTNTKCRLYLKGERNFPGASIATTTNYWYDYGYVIFF